MPYICIVSPNLILSIDGVEDQTHVALTATANGELRVRRSILTTGAWHTAPEVLRTPSATLLRIQANDGPIYAQVHDDRVELLAGAPSLAGATLLPIKLSSGALAASAPPAHAPPVAPVTQRLSTSASASQLPTGPDTPTIDMPASQLPTGPDTPTIDILAASIPPSKPAPATPVTQTDAVSATRETAWASVPAPATPAPQTLAGTPAPAPAANTSPTIMVAAPPTVMIAPPTPVIAVSARPHRPHLYLLIGLVAVLALIGGGVLILRTRGAGSPAASASRPTISAPPATASPRPARTAVSQQNTQPKQPAIIAAPRPTTTEAPTTPPAPAAQPASAAPPAPTPTLPTIPTLPVASQAVPAVLPPGRINISASGVAPPSVSRCGDQTTFDARNVIDGMPETTWRVPGDGRGAVLQLTFDAPVRVADLRIIPGYAKIDACDKTDRFTQNRRVRQVELTFSDGSTASATLRDAPELQSIMFPPVVATWVRVTIVATTDPGSVNGRDFTPISEIVVIGSAP